MVSLLSRLTSPGRRAPGHPVWLAAAAAAAVTALGLVGLGLALVVVQTLDPTGGLPVGGSAELAGRLWLLAHGGRLQLPSGPLAVAPLLLTLAVAWGLCRVGRGVVAARDVAGARAAAEVVGIVLAVHALLTLLVAVVVGAPGRGLLQALAGAAGLALLATGWGVARESGLLAAALDRLPAPLRPVPRGAAAGLLAALALCTAVVAVAVAADAEGYAALTADLGGSGAGAVGSLGLALLLLPNAAAAVLGLAAGPGFSIGAGTLVSVHGVTLGPLPALPLLAALPDTQAVPLVAWVSQAIPAVAGLVAGAAVGRRLAPGDGGPAVAGLAGLLAGVLLGAGAAAVAWAGGGVLGDGGLAEVGAPPLATGIAVAAQAGIAGAVGAAVARWRARD
ncbi:MULTISPECIES: cell division protein PerM [unclassified Blastococcus]